VVRKRWLRLTACCSVALMLWQTLQPLNAAAQVLGEEAAPAATWIPHGLVAKRHGHGAEAQHAAPVPQTAAERYGAHVARMHRLLKDLVPQAAMPAAAKKGEKQLRAIGPNLRVEVEVAVGPNEVNPKLAQLSAEYRALQPLAKEVDRELAEVGKDIAARKLPDVILERHHEAVREYAARNAEFQRLTAVVEAAQAKSSPALPGALAELGAFLAGHTSEPPHVPLDPRKLPFRPAAPARQPYTSAQQLERLFPANRILVAQAGNFSGLGLSQTALPPTPTDEDLGETEEVRLTPAVRDLARSLDNNPVRIFNWVHNNIVFVPTYGSVQGSEFTLQAQQGNAFDTASLLIALLRAANVPARYAYGTVDVPIERAMNWVGGATTPEGATAALGQGGIPSVGMLNGGRLVAVRMEHVWVEAWVDYVPSRGAVNRVGDTWASLDASFKQYQFIAPVNVRAAVSFNGAAALDRIRATAQVDAQAGSITGLDSGAVEGIVEDAQRDLTTYLVQNQPTMPVEDVIGNKRIVQSELKVLPGGLPHAVVARAAPFRAIPRELQHRLTIVLYESEFDRLFGSSGASLELSLPAIAGKRLGVTYAPATAADAAALESYRNSHATALPLHALRVKPQIQLDGSTLLEGAAATMGLTQFWETGLSGPDTGVNDSQLFRVSAGDEMVFGVNGNGINQAAIHQRFLKTSSETAAENLHTVAMYYWAENDRLDQMIGDARGVFIQRLPSIGLFSAPLQVTYGLFGAPRSGYYAVRAMDVQRSLSGVSARDGRASTASAYRTASVIGSYLEGAVFEQLFNRERGAGVSAVQLLADANAQGIPVYVVTAANLAQVQPKLAIDADAKADIVNAVSAGRTAYVPERAPLHGEWQGLGYIIEDPQTGAGAYLIKGGLNGGSDNPCNPEPEPEPVRVPVFEILLALLFIALLILLILFLPEILAGLGALGGVLGGAEPVAAALLLMLGLGASPANAAVGPGPFPGDAMVPPGDCTIGQHLLLQAAVDTECHGAPSCRQFPLGPCPLLDQARDRFLRCALARTTINTTCFRGGNRGHRIAEEEAYNAVAVCECLLLKNGCPP
jgi:hypothetical protein